MLGRWLLQVALQRRSEEARKLDERAALCMASERCTRDKGHGEHRASCTSELFVASELFVLNYACEAFLHACTPLMLRRKCGERDDIVARR